MGTCISKDKTDHEKYGYSKDEFEELRRVYREISEHKIK